MWALLQDGPFANQHYAVEDPAPETITLEAMPTDDDLLVPIPPGGEFPTAHFERRAYRLMGPGLGSRPTIAVQPATVGVPKRAHSHLRALAVQ
jgi:hypothetical protein